MISFLLREGSIWGGDNKTVLSIAQAMRALRKKRENIPEIGVFRHLKELPPSSFVWICNSTRDLRSHQAVLHWMGASYGVIPFHEDPLQFRAASSGFYGCVRFALEGKQEKGIPLSLDLLEENPHLVHYYGYLGNLSCKHFVNREILEKAEVCVVNPGREALTLKRDAPRARIAPVLWAPGFGDVFLKSPLHDDFLKWTGLSSGEYILQVGRPERRKNQLATILATRDLPYPLVLVFPKASHEHYFTTCLEAIVRWRKAPTWIIAQGAQEATSGMHRILAPPQGKKLSVEMLHSAFGHAGLYLHPAFYELPGLTYLEAAALGIPTIASSWATIGDYFEKEPLPDDRIEQVCPYDLPAIRSLVQKKFGQKYPVLGDHPVFARTWEDVAYEILGRVVNYSKNFC